MNILSLNCRGGGRPETVREISDLVRLQRPSLVFLSETKMSDKKAQDLRWKFGFSNAFGVKSVGLSGGLCLYWNNDSRVSLKSFSNSHIDVLIQNDELGDVEWRFTGFYGNPVRSRRKLSWDLLKFLRKEYNNPWICAGDFNEVLYGTEQIGGNERQEWKMEGFRDAIEECKLEDLGFYGVPYTWDNKQQGNKNVKVRLDRALGDDKFQECFDNTIVNHLQCCESDHCALLISVRQSDWIDVALTEKPFRFENAWTRHERYNQTVEEVWRDDGNNLQEVYDALGCVRQRLKRWSVSEFGSVKKQLKTLRGRLEVEIKAVTAVKIPQLHPNSWAIDIIDSSKVDPRDAAVILCGGWAVWSERNARKHGESSRTISESVKWTADIASDLAISGCVVTRPAKVKSKWQLPAPGTLKVNVDAGFSSDWQVILDCRGLK
ncbi:uncharacterized protein [Lolium perenne]|uniref:uncharacterized protein n=1 Tax=Lolium perenne TaxID=4522 RepID=UPI003A98DB1A